MATHGEILMDRETENRSLNSEMICETISSLPMPHTNPHRASSTPPAARLMPQLFSETEGTEGADGGTRSRLLVMGQGHCFRRVSNCLPNSLVFPAVFLAFLGERIRAGC